MVGWQLMAMHSAKAAQLNVSQQSLDRANQFLDSVQVDNYGALYSYQPGGPATPAMTAEGMFVRQLHSVIREYAQDEDEVASEIRDLCEILSG